MSAYRFAISVTPVEVYKEWSWQRVETPQPITITLEAHGKDPEEAAENLERAIGALVRDEIDGDLVRRRI